MTLEDVRSRSLRPTSCGALDLMRSNVARLNAKQRTRKSIRLINSPTIEAAQPIRRPEPFARKPCGGMTHGPATVHGVHRFLVFWAF